VLGRSNSMRRRLSLRLLINDLRCTAGGPNIMGSKGVTGSGWSCCRRSFATPSYEADWSSSLAGAGSFLLGPLRSPTRSYPHWAFATSARRARELRLDLARPAFGSQDFLTASSTATSLRKVQVWRDEFSPSTPCSTTWSSASATRCVSRLHGPAFRRGRKPYAIRPRPKLGDGSGGHRLGFSR